MKQGLCKSAIWKSTWPVTRKASLYPTDKCDDCLTPRKVPKARAISKNNRVYRLLLLLPRATGNHEIKGTRPSYNVARLYLPFMERSKGWGISRSYSDFIRLRARLLDQDIPEEIPLKDIQSGNQRRINIKANLFIEKNSYACPKYEEICWLFFLRTNLEPSRITTKKSVVWLIVAYGFFLRSIFLPKRTSSLPYNDITCICYIEREMFDIRVSNNRAIYRIT